MLKSLVASCLCALSVNTQAVNVSPPSEPSRAITSETTFNVGDYVSLDYNFIYDEGNSYIFYELLLNSDTGSPQLDIVSYKVISIFPYVLSFSDNLSNIDYISFCVSSNHQISFLSGDNVLDIETLDFQFNVDLVDSSLTYSYVVSITFRILEGFEGFTGESFPYLTKIEPPYTPPAKSNLYRLLYDFYYSLFSDDDLAQISTGYNMPFDNWLAHTCTIVTLLVLVFICFLFLKWLFKVISGLILLKH